MGIFDNYFGKWIKVVDSSCFLTIEDFNYNTGVIEGTTDNHCSKCVAVNQCWFKDENNKKPEPLLQTGIIILDEIISGFIPGLYHYNCHCKEIPISNPNENDIQLIISEGKINWLFLDKGEWVNSMGYYNDDYFIQILEKEIKKSYCMGKYQKVKHTNFGFQINIFVNIKGENEKITIQVVGNGPLGTMVVCGNSKGEVKGYVNNPLAEAQLNEKMNKSPFLSEKVHIFVQNI